MKVLLLNQCFWPDVVATAQQLTDLAKALAQRGHEVTVVCGDRGYDDPQVRFPRRERWHNIDIIRVRSIAADKKSRRRRALNFTSFLITCAARLIFLRRQDVVVALTSPPLISWLAALFTRLKGGRLVFWVMDLNPDEAIAAGWLNRKSMTAKLLDALLRQSMRASDRIVVLDRFMKERVAAKGVATEKIGVIAPWAHDDEVRFDQAGREAFRREHNLSGKFVVMYAGNHSPCHPLDTLVAGARALNSRTDIAFCFAGGGSEQQRVREFAVANQPDNILCLPYQPIDKLSGVLSAADLHVVVMGEKFVGIVHPSKIYNVLMISAPFLYIGPTQSHLGDMIARLGPGARAFQARHGEIDRVAETIANCADQARAESNEETRAQVDDSTAILAREFSRSTLLPILVSQLESLGASREHEVEEPAGSATVRYSITR